MFDHEDRVASSKPLLALIALTVVCYAMAVAAGLLQREGENSASVHHAAGEAADASPRDAAHTAAHGATHATAYESEHAESASHPPYWMIAPFALLLLVIAVFPLVPRVSKWWESNSHKFAVAIALSGVTLLYYLFLHHGPIIRRWPVEHLLHPTEDLFQFSLALIVLENAVIFEYVPFIVLLLTLYTISGGLRIDCNYPAHPATNSTFLAVGAVLANLIGTTGAAMVLIRPLLETNRERKHVRHTVIFFIFVVCNCGGCLLPIGDPPLFLGYLRGVPFLWTLRLWPQWLVTNGVLVAMYYLLDRWWWYPREQPKDIAVDEVRTHRIRIAGIWPNVPLLLLALLAVMFLDSAKTFPGTNWRPWPFLRENVQLLLIALSLVLGDPATRRQNRFNYHAILEVAALFLGIFICMQAPLQILHVRGPSLGLSQPSQFFWITGGLSAVLDNAPTYEVFFETARSLGVSGNPVAGVREPLLVAVSLGAVFMGAMTYIGNGPNFMVKSIAEESGIAMPSFFGYLLYSLAFLIPLFVVGTLWFLR